VADVCVSSQDDRPQCWDNPWVFEGDLADGYAAILRVVRKLGGSVVAGDGERYLRAEFESRSPIGTPAVDDAEWFFTVNDTLVQFRSARRGDALSDFGANRQRLEKIRIALGWEKVPVVSQYTDWTTRADLTFFQPCKIRWV